MAKGDGTIIKKGRGTYEVQVSFGRNIVTGKYERATRTVHGTMADARKARDELRRQHEGGASIDSQRMTFSELADLWLKQIRGEGKLATTTTDDYTAIVRTMEEIVGNVKIRDMSPLTINDLYNRIRSERGIGENRLNKFHVVLSQIFEKAEDYDLVLRNPMDKVKRPKAPHAKRRSLKASEVVTLHRALVEGIGSEYSASLGHDPETRSFSMLRVSRLWAVRLALATGMRRGELLALQWKHIDLNGGVLHVVQSINCNGELKTPKTDAGIRGIYIDPETTQALATWKATQAEMLADICVDQTPETPVCCSTIGTFINVSNFERWWRGYRESIGFDGLKIHELRHTHATLLVADGKSAKTVQRRLGHSDVSLTLNVYTHATPENDREAANAFGKIQSGGHESKVIKLKSA